LIDEKQRETINGHTALKILGIIYVKANY